jgi:hypothetical protein
MVVGRKMNIKRFFYLGITFVWVFISIIFINVIDKRKDYSESIMTIDNSKKMVYKIFNTPLRWIDEKSFISISSKSDMCNKYIENGGVNLKYEHKGKIYTVDKYGNFNIDSNFKYKDPIKIILETKKDIEQCKFNIFVYPGKFSMLLTGIVFFWLPIFLIYGNVFLPIIKYFRRRKTPPA